eukprot:TRINITY_DN7596_c0_g1_i1.p1 TRINITY_DN7596_c0_g1~~TRINITY_DN7596_c0_g1_i1.p1  ORF type:complete len:749 (+),score=108.18 TRINITY_DN7596_c0_g1_i1:2-2248(+)
MAQDNPIKDFDKELWSIAESPLPVSQKKINRITELALKYIKYYKFVVYSVEKFVHKVAANYKVPGIYVIDSIINNSRYKLKNKDPFGPRFAQRLAGTFEPLRKASQADQQNALRVVDIWRTKGVYTAEECSKLEKALQAKGNSPKTTHTSGNDPRRARPDPRKADPRKAQSDVVEEKKSAFADDFDYGEEMSDEQRRQQQVAEMRAATAAPLPSQPPAAPLAPASVSNGNPSSVTAETPAPAVATDLNALLGGADIVSTLSQMLAQVQNAPATSAPSTAPAAPAAPAKPAPVEGGPAAPMPPPPQAPPMAQQQEFQQARAMQPSQTHQNNMQPQQGFQSTGQQALQPYSNRSDPRSHGSNAYANQQTNTNGIPSTSNGYPARPPIPPPAMGFQPTQPQQAGFQPQSQVNYMPPQQPQTGFAPTQPTFSPPNNATSVAPFVPGGPFGDCQPGMLRLLSSTLWIGSIPRDAPSVELERLLEPYGPRDIKHLYERQQAFVIVKSRQSAEHAVRYLDGFDMQGSRLKVNYAKGLIQKGSQSWEQRTGVSYYPLVQVHPGNLKSLIDGCVVDRCTCPPDLLADLDRLPHDHYDSRSIGGLKGIEARREGDIPTDYDAPELPAHNKAISDRDFRRRDDFRRHDRSRDDRRDRDYNRRGDDRGDYRPRDEYRRPRSRSRSRSPVPRDREGYRSRDNDTPPRRSRSREEHQDDRDSFGRNLPTAVRDSQQNPVFEPPNNIEAEKAAQKPKRSSRWD